MKLPRCQYRSKSKMQRPMKRWLENPMNKRPLIPSSTCRLGRLGLRTYLGQPHRKVILRRHSISLFHQVSGGTKNKKPQEQPSSSLGCGQGSPCPVMAPGSLTTDGYDLLTTQLLVFWGNRLWSWAMGFVRELPSFGICLFKATELLIFKFCSQNNQFLYNQSDTATVIWRTRDS